MMSLRARAGRSVGFKELVNTEFGLLQKRFEGSEPSRMWTGLVDLDELLGEPTPGSVLEVRCTSSMVRSAFLLSAAIASARNGQRTLLVSTQAALAQMGLRLLSQVSGVRLMKLRDGRLDERDWSAVARANKSDLPLTIVAPLKHTQRVFSPHLPHCGDIDLIILDGCDDHRLLRRAAKLGCPVVYGPTQVAASEGVTVKPSISVSLSSLDKTMSPFKIIEAVVEETQLHINGRVRLVFDQRRLRFLNGCALTFDGDDETAE